MASGGPPQIFDRRAYAAARARGARRGTSFLAEEAAQGIAERLSAVNRQFADALDLGSRSESSAILKPHARNWSRAALSDNEHIAVEPEKYDLAVSVLALHAVNDLPGVLVQIRRALKPDGLFIAALFGGETLRELRAAFLTAEVELSGGSSARVAPFADVRDMGSLLQRAGFALPVSDSERTIVRYRNFDSLVGDLRDLGETNALALRNRASAGRKLRLALERDYARASGDPDGRLRATFDVLYLTGWAPHESQQKPIAPGSARTRLSDALGVEEHKAGDAARPKSR